LIQQSIQNKSNFDVEELFNLKMSYAVLKETLRVASPGPFVGIKKYFCDDNDDSVIEKDHDHDV